MADGEVKVGGRVSGQEWTERAEWGEGTEWTAVAVVVGNRLFCGHGNAGSRGGGALASSGGCRKEMLQSVGKRLRGEANAVILRELG
jgi:hypothetical protein